MYSDLLEVYFEGRRPSLTLLMKVVLELSKHHQSYMLHSYPFFRVRAIVNDL